MRRLAVLTALALALLALPAGAVGVGPTQYGCVNIGGGEYHYGVYFGDYAHDAFGVAWSVSSQNNHQVGSSCSSSVNLNAAVISATVKVERSFYPVGWTYCTQVTQTLSNAKSAAVNPKALNGQGPCGQANWPAGYTRVTLDGYYQAFPLSSPRYYHRVFTS